MKKVSLTQVTVGMRLVSGNIDWKQHPLVFCGEVVITSQEQIDTLIREGYKEAFVAEQATPAPKHTRPVPTVPLAEELPAAKKLHEQSTQYARKFLGDIGKGKFDYAGAAPMVEGVLASLDRNVDALLALSRLHHTDSYTYGHCVNVSILTMAFAGFLGLEQEKLYASGFGGLFHDLGKGLVPLQVLNAPRKLSKAEFLLMQQHPLLGYEQLQKVSGIPETVLQAALEHHEKYDGSGYPQRIRGDAISRMGAMTAMADVYDALTSKRVYKDPMTPNQALGLMFQLRDKDWETKALQDFIHMLGVYPVGSTVLLEDGWKGVVARVTEKMLEPVVAIVFGPKGEKDLRLCEIMKGECAPILRSITPHEAGLDPLDILQKVNQ